MRVLIIFFSIFLLFSCEKKDNILSNIYSVPIEFNSNWYNTPSGVRFHYLDIDQDGINDFEFKVHHWTIQNSYYSSSVRIRSISPCHNGAGFAVDGYVTIFNLNQEINSSVVNSYEVSNTTLSAHAPYGDDFETGYIAVLVNGCFGWIHVESALYNGIRIYGYGINLTKGNSIRAGQTQ